MTADEQLAALREFAEGLATPGPHEFENCQLVDIRFRQGSCVRCEAIELLAKLDADDEATHDGG